MKTTILRLGVAPIIERPADSARVQQLQGKLREYALRPSVEARYKRAILSRVLGEGAVSWIEVAAHAAADTGPGPAFDRALFDDCWNVIHDYCKTGGARTVLGSGLAAG